MNRKRSDNAPRRPVPAAPESPRPTIDPPRPNRAFLATAAALLATWLAFLGALAVWAAR